MKHRAIFVVLVLMIVGCVGLARAQNTAEDPPLIMQGVVGEDSHEYRVYRLVDGDWEQIPTKDLGQASLSLDGRWLVYQRVPPFLKTLEGGMDWLYGTAWDLVLVDMEDGSERVIAEQPSTIAATDTGYQGGIKRSLPVWVGYDAKIAWIEQDYPAQEAARLLVYDLETETTQVLDKAVPFMTLSADGMPSVLSWGQPGLSVFTNDPDDGMPTLRLYKYDLKGDKPKILRLTDIEDTEWWPWTGLIWNLNYSTDGPPDNVAFPASDAWYQVDASMETVSLFDAHLRATTPYLVENALSVVWNTMAIYEDNGEPAWKLFYDTETKSIDLDLSMNHPVFALSPSGRAAAYVEDGTLLIWQDGAAISISLPEDVRVTDLFWGPIFWTKGKSYR